ncbi:hypothetical protein NQ314_003960 [Rhamnusium bicolor]|uniref:Uncharacterized protein n=1 Tax=Rhamnusium bicolor TaxID=1586634 RepID=A0AAV8ZKF4_9CUCU|nr:hypothetical protein NQ314_003960 [Rhamnusium bicolor]
MLLSDNVDISKAKMICFIIQSFLTMPGGNGENWGKKQSSMFSMSNIYPCIYLGTWWKFV